MLKVEQWQAGSIICQSGGAALADALYDYDAHFQIALRNEDAILFTRNISLFLRSSNASKVKDTKYCKQLGEELIFLLWAEGQRARNHLTYINYSNDLSQSFKGQVMQP